MTQPPPRGPPVPDSIPPSPVGAVRNRTLGTLLVLRGRSSHVVHPLSPTRPTVLGCEGDADIVLGDADLLAAHARILPHDGLYLLEPVGPAVRVDGATVTAPRLLRGGDRITVGAEVELRFDLHDALEQKVLTRLGDSAVRDPLTGLYNRRHFDEQLEREVAYARRRGADLALLFLDVDHFKPLNDRHGHRAGDAVLRVLARSLLRTVRPEDLVCRYGGEELCVVARDLDHRNGWILGDRLRRLIEGLSLPWGGETLRVTVSVGVACLLHDLGQPTPARLVHRADAAMYRAKHQGRNRCVLAQPGDEPGADGEC